MAGTALYTRTGDSGQTSLGTGRRVPKTNGTLEVLGNIDELISQIAVARSSLPQEETDLTGTLKTLQNELLLLKEDVSSMNTARLIGQKQVEQLEQRIDALAPFASVKEEDRAASATGAAAQLDLCRSLVRRMERSLMKAGLPSSNHQKYVNRLSDYFYAAARYVDSRMRNRILEAEPRPDRPFPLKLAKLLLEAVERVAEERGLKLVIAACDAAGRPIAVHVMDDAFIASYDIAVNKAWTAVSLKMPTKELAELCKPGGSLYGLQNTNDGKVVIFGGGVPLTDRTGRVIGGAAVSGSTAEIDTEMGDICKTIFDQLYEALGASWT